MRRRRSSTGDEVTLFPFLAVLICTMGSLIVLLVVMVQQARATAADRTRERSERQQTAADDAQQLQTQIEDLRWRIEVLRDSQTQTVADLRSRQAELSYMEDEIRQLRSRLDRAAQEAAQIEQLLENEEDTEHASREQLTQLRERLDYARESLDQARRQFNDREHSYALVPYTGASGTRRRPIYIECTSDRVILQPEGVELFSDDFREPLTDDNALAAALRAQREYFADTTQQRDEPPYPLIVVRPDGAHAYGAARAAMKSWDAEFGYELVDDDMKLAFPEVDATLVDIVREAVDEARVRRRLLQSMAPARFGRNQSSLVASRSGGFVNGGAGDTPPHSPPGLAPGHGGSLTGEPGSQDMSGQPDAGSSAGHAGRGSGDATFAAGESGGEPGADADSRLGPEANGASAATGSMASSRGQGKAGGLGPHSGENGAAENETARFGESTEPVAEGARAGAGQKSSDGRNSGSSQGSPAQRNGSKDAANMAGGATSGPSSPGGSAAGGASGGFGSSTFAADASNSGQGRGTDWGLPGRAEGATGITRPINVACYPDRLVMFPEDVKGGRPFVLKVEGRLSDEVDSLVSHIWKRMESWGIAGNRMYWKPVLQVQVQAGADGSYAELARLLHDSGIVVKRK